MRACERVIGVRCGHTSLRCVYELKSGPTTSCLSALFVNSISYHQCFLFNEFRGAFPHSSNDDNEDATHANTQALITHTHTQQRRQETARRPESATRQTKPARLRIVYCSRIPCTAFPNTIQPLAPVFKCSRVCVCTRLCVSVCR